MGHYAAMLDAGEFDALARILLGSCYDPLCLRSERGRAYAATVGADDLDRAAHEVLA